MIRLCFVAVLALGMGGCSWLEKQNAEVCVVYKGRQICAKRVDGVWSFSADLSKDEQDQIINDIER